VNRLDRLVAPWATRDPARMAIEGADESLTYGDLDQLANRFANAFLESGILPGERVGVHLPRSGRGVAAMLGAMRAGAVYVPLDPSSPPVRMGLIARDCALRHVVVSPALFAGWLAAGVLAPVEHVFLSAHAPPVEVPGARVHAWSEIERESPIPPPSPGSDPDELAYMLYTSGSTGVPKGVMLSHRNALSFADWTADWVNLKEGDRVSSVAPFHFDLSVFDLWSSFSRGATVVIVDEATVTSGRRMLDRIHAGRITVCYCVPSALMLMLENGGLEERGAPLLREVLFAGEVFPMKQLRRTMAALPGARFYNLFGPTETNVCLAWALPGIPDAEALSIPIGLPSCGDVATVVDLDGRPVTDGEVGELFIEGPTVMLGYWDGGRRTLARHPYPTGDLVARRPDGAYLYHGRRDHLVKIHGFRVELGEVEAALNAHPGLREAIAFAVDQQLVAVAVPEDPSVSVMDVKRHCVSRLPRYMVPGDVRLVRALPRTSNGKADRVRTRAAYTEGDTQVLEPAPRAGA
jgi:amino acid adenylation domain-containing protein